VGERGWGTPSSSPSSTSRIGLDLDKFTSSFRSLLFFCAPFFNKSYEQTPAQLWCICSTHGAKPSGAATASATTSKHHHCNCLWWPFYQAPQGPTQGTGGHG
jgi:hypothetical protein